MVHFVRECSGFDGAAEPFALNLVNVTNHVTPAPVKDNSTINNTQYIVFPQAQKSIVGSEINLQPVNNESTPKKILAYLAVPSVVYIQLLRDRLGRVKRDTSDNFWEKIRSLRSELDHELAQVQRPKSDKIPRVNDNKISIVNEAINQTTIYDQNKTNLNNETENINNSKKPHVANTNKVNSSKDLALENNGQVLQQRSSRRKRLDNKRRYNINPFQPKLYSEVVDDSTYDYIPSTIFDENEKGGRVYSHIDNPAYKDYEDYYDGEEEENKPNNPSEILDVHDTHDSDYEYIPPNESVNKEQSEEIDERENSKGTEVHNDSKNNYSDKENPSPYHNPFYENLFKSEFVEQIIPQSNTKPSQEYIKEPLAGANATRGFGHDFKAQRGNKVKSNSGTQLPNRFPTVGYFSTKEVHNLLQQPQVITNNSNDNSRLKNITKNVVLQPVPTSYELSDETFEPGFTNSEESSGFLDHSEIIAGYSPEYDDIDYEESASRPESRENIKSRSNYKTTVLKNAGQSGKAKTKVPQGNKGNDSYIKNRPTVSKNNRIRPSINDQTERPKQRKPYNKLQPRPQSDVDGINEEPVYIVYPTNSETINTEMSNRDTTAVHPKRSYETDDRDGQDSVEETRDEESKGEGEEENTGLYRTISAILDGKDKISRDQNFHQGRQPQVYNNYWSLEYSFPKRK